MNQFDIFIESIKQLYIENKINKEKINSLYFSGKITKEEKEYILDTH